MKYVVRFFRHNVAEFFVNAPQFQWGRFTKNEAVINNDSKMKNRNLNHSDNWATPKKLYDELNAEFNFDFDPCPLNEEEITPDKDGLLIEWGHRNYINPPYRRDLKEAFVKKAIQESNNGKLCVMLLPVSTSTKLFHEHIKPNASEIRFLKGRVKFLGKNTKGEYVENKAGMHDSMVVVFKAQPIGSAVGG